MLQNNINHNKEVPQNPTEDKSKKVNKSLLDQSIKDKQKSISTNQTIKK